VDLELDRQHLPVGGQDGQRGIAAGDIDQARHDAAMKQAVLLCQPFAEAARDGHRPGLDPIRHGAKRAHESLSLKALANAFHGWMVSSFNLARW
jgi:hypothetical protein